jgi:hypothetical protein
MSISRWKKLAKKINDGLINKNNFSVYVHYNEIMQR